MAKIIIELNTDAGDTLEKALAAIAPPPLMRVSNEIKNPDFRPGGIFVERSPTFIHETVNEDPIEPAAPVDELLEASKLGPMDGDRKRGHGRAPSKRRTNAQIAEDNRWFAYLETIKTNGETALSIADAAALAEPNEENEPVEEAVKPEPETPPSDPEVAAQDAADEAAESAKTAEAPRTTLQRAIAAYVKKFGAAVATTEMQKIIGKPSRDLTDAEIPDAVVRLTAAMGAEPESAAKFTPVETAPDAPIDPASVTIENVREAMMAYGVKYDGTSNPKKMTFTAEDMPWVLQHTFSIGVVSPERIPKNEKHGYHKALLAIRDAIENNPRNRMLKAFRG